MSFLSCPLNTQTLPKTIDKGGDDSKLKRELHRIFLFDSNACKELFKEERITRLDVNVNIIFPVPVINFVNYF